MWRGDSFVNMHDLKTIAPKNFDYVYILQNYSIQTKLILLEKNEKLYLSSEYAHDHLALFQ